MTFRNIPEDVKRKFAARAAANGLSMEEAGRRMIIESVANDQGRPNRSIGEMLYEASRPGVELRLPKRTRARTPRFDAE
jgi:plasmid stability protein